MLAPDHSEEQHKLASDLASDIILNLTKRYPNANIGLQGDPNDHNYGRFWFYKYYKTYIHGAVVVAEPSTKRHSIYQSPGYWMGVPPIDDEDQYYHIELGNPNVIEMIVSYIDSKEKQCNTQS